MHKSRSSGHLCGSCCCCALRANSTVAVAAVVVCQGGGEAVVVAASGVFNVDNDDVITMSVMVYFK